LKLQTIKIEFKLEDSKQNQNLKQDIVNCRSKAAESAGESEISNNQKQEATKTKEMKITYHGERAMKEMLWLAGEEREYRRRREREREKRRRGGCVEVKSEGG